MNYIELNGDCINRLKEKIKIIYNRTPLFFIETYGCQQNEADSEKLMGMAKEIGFDITDDKNEADLILFNTCAVREHAELKALSHTGHIKHLKELNPSLIVGLCGCMVQQEHRKEDIKHKYPYVDFVFGTNMIFKFPQIVEKVLERTKRQFFVESYETNKGDMVEEVPVLRKSTKTAWVSIMYGCNNFCTYCVVPYVRGRERSREMSAVISEVKDLVSKGYKDITLLGQNVNSYGKDLKDTPSFVDLLRALDEIQGDFVLRFMTSHPKDATHELFDFISQSRHMAPHFHLPMQSGSDRILSEMNRHYDRKTFLELCKYAKSVMPEISLTTDVIVGFPGETEEDFVETLSALEEVRFDSVYSFIYSKRKGTKAAEMTEQIDDETKKDRMGRLLELQQKISNENNLKLVNKVLKVIIEGNSKTNENVWAGRTEQGKIIHFPKDSRALLPGQVVDVEVERTESYTIYGKLK
ncbi:MAG: tRNA (N6-isopentenyl adenosine(37)-C2)-methylthiotransferase MiaB [Ruminococcaceae bacterium]|nr:tRNA (N6-isopentenyl adenosine(37)-C2)-methylthiotransferase MiaB [Oscillospiraceae bacterium]